MADKTLPGYPVQLGGKQKWAIQHVGPALYQQGGETYDIAHLNGGGSIDMIHGSRSFNANNTNTYIVSVNYPVGQAAIGATGSSTVKLVWSVAANATECANNTVLSAEFCRLELLGG
jgi:hypothetical protein